MADEKRQSTALVPVPVERKPDALRSARNHARRDQARLARLRQAFETATRAEDVAAIQAEIDQLEREIGKADAARREIARSKNISKLAFKIGSARRTLS